MRAADRSTGCGPAHDARKPPPLQRDRRRGRRPGAYVVGARRRWGLGRWGTGPATRGVDVTLDVGEGLPHVYQLNAGTPEAVEATERIGRFLRARVKA